MPDIVKPEKDTRQYRTLTLENGLQALLIHDPPPVRDTGKSDRLSAAALCVGVGSFSDPKELPGLAHFLEHMVFMGSEKFPEESDFDAYLKKYGGSSNAYTDCERTVFYFDVTKDNLKSSLDRFAQFFVNPLMRQDSVDREIKAVDSEFDMALTNDHHRKEQLLGSLAREDHPMSKFMWGNVQSLKLRPQEKGLDVYHHLRQFHKKFYSSHFMTLAVQSRESLDCQEEWISEIFAAVPHNNQDRPVFTDEQHLFPFSGAGFHKLYKAIPVKNIHQVEVCWALPPLLQHFRKKPLAYIGFLLGHEGKGSILSFLKKKHWATAIDAGNSDTNFELNSTWSFCGISVTLTEQGFQHIPEVLAAIFQYINMMQREGPCERLFREIQTVENNGFRFSDQCDPADYVQRLCENMQMYPCEQYLTGDRLLHEYDPELIQSCQLELAPDKANILLYSKHFAKEDGCNMQEEWFQTKYSVEPIPEEWMKQWQDKEHDPRFHLPEENAFIATNFDLLEIDVGDVPEHPVKLLDTDKSLLWYKKDSKFRTPKGVVYLVLKSGIFNQSASNAVMGDMLVRILDHNLTEVAYPAEVAGLSYEFLCLHSNGLHLKVSGFSHKLPKLLETLIDHLTDLEVTDRVFDMVKEQLKRIYHNIYIKPSSLVTDVRVALLQQTHWMPVTKRECLDSITADMFKTFFEQFKSHLFVETYVHGNFSQQDALTMEKYVCERLAASPLAGDSFSEKRVVELPVGERFCRVQNINQADCNSVIANYYQLGPATIYQDVIDDLMVYHMEEPAFEYLRTKEQLGYSVYASSHNTLDTVGFSVTVCSQAHKFGMKELNGKMEDFLLKFAADIDKMTENDFQKLVSAMITLKSCQDNNMAEEAQRNWLEIVDRRYVFDRLARQIDVLRSLTLEEFQKWYHSRIPSGGSAKKLSVQVVGNPNAKRSAKTSESEDGDGDESEDDASSSDEDEMEQDGDESFSGEEEIPETPVDVPAKLKFLPVEEEIVENNISDIRKFKDGLKLYQTAKL